jgi:hypothetical protein
MSDKSYTLFREATGLGAHSINTESPILVNAKKLDAAGPTTPLTTKQSGEDRYRDHGIAQR